MLFFSLLWDPNYEILVPNEHIIEWKGSPVFPKDDFIFHIKAKNIISNGFIYHLDWVNDFSLEAFSLHSTPLINEVFEVFLDDLSGVLPDRERYFWINIFPTTYPIFLTYRMAPFEHKELKEPLNDLLKVLSFVVFIYGVR